MTANMIGLALILIGVFLLIGKWIRTVTPALQRIFLPSSIIGGLVALLLGPEIAGRLEIPGTADLAGLFPEAVVSVWRALPGLLINVIFASLFIGKTIPGLREVWLTAGPQVAFGQMIAWGQYTFGILLAVVVLAPLFDLPPMAGALIEIGFQGGHGTAAGLDETFARVGFQQATDLALGLATVGIVSGLIIGVALINWGARAGHSRILHRPDEIPEQELKGIIDKSQRQPAGYQITTSASIDILSLTVSVIGLAILIGWILLEGLVLLEALTWGRLWNTAFMSYVPLFPMAMLGGLITQRMFARFGADDVIDRGLVVHVQGWSLDVLIVAALASLSLTVIGENLIPFALLALVGICWNVLAFLLLARRMLPDYWFERGMVDLGQSMGVTPTGLLLLRIADPHDESPALKAFGYKQLMFEPIVGGGLFTALSVPLIFELGPYPVLGLASVLMLGWLAAGVLYFGRQ